MTLGCSFRYFSRVDLLEAELAGRRSIQRANGDNARPAGLELGVDLLPSLLFWS